MVDRVGKKEGRMVRFSTYQVVVLSVFLLWGCGTTTEQESGGTSDGVMDVVVTDVGPDVVDVQDEPDTVQADVLENVLADVSTEEEEPVIEVVPGQSIAEITVGMTMVELRELVGDPDSQFGFQRLINARYNDLAIEVLLTSTEASFASDDARVRSISTLPGAGLKGELTLDLTREDLEAKFGPVTLESSGVVYFVESGLAVELSAENRATRYAIWPPYQLQAEPPEMLPAETEMVDEVVSETDEALPEYEFEGETYRVVDMHLHIGTLEGQYPSGVAFLLSQLPPQSLMYFPSTAGLVLDPYGEHVGIQEHLRAAGVAHGVLLATYTHKTVGYARNRLLEDLLDDPRNVNVDGSPFAWGMVSINFDGYEEPEVKASRLAALESYFVQRPDLFIGIKLAHAQQAVGFDDPLYMEVYDVAAKYGVPMLLHTGLSPFPNSATDPHFYDPASLEAVITAYDGAHGQGKVDFVLAHTGQGDARAIESSLQLAAAKDNVWLELSAINRPLQIDENGEDIDSDEPMHPYVLGEILNRDLVSKAIFATDGPQYFGKTQSALKLLVGEMVTIGYSPDDIQGVLADNFFRCFFAQ